eukprot:TRINITY_DN72938_c0_g1_i1.p1 TRINITY_DN72938_c0_g1~~TRINITY_DN72938_c0_g1_i1.p1  ORF type:complete len:412 (-),score=48.15 TRINITY_DN72938_c0_g1_i1:9-1244(-)
MMARRRLHVLFGTTVGFDALARNTSTSCNESGRTSKPWSSSYLNRGMQDSSVIADRFAMNKLYVEDIHRLRSLAADLPFHVPLTKQASYISGGGSHRLRILTWNINLLCGPDGSASAGALRRIDPDEVAEVINRTNPDVICLQEAIDWIPPSYKEYLEREGVGELDQRMQRLNRHLLRMGFGPLLRSCTPPSIGNPVLLASRVPVKHSEVCTLAPSHARAAGMGAPRTAAYMDIAVSRTGSRTLGIYATHLHHINYAPRDGQRKAEVESLIAHANQRQQHSHRLATVITGDFNQARQKDYSEAEWRVIAAGLAKVQQPENDGVAELLEKSGYVCAYDVVPRASNFGIGSPPFTHWTGTTVDYLYIAREVASDTLVCKASLGSVRVVGTYLFFSDLSDHLPILTDLEIDVPS